MAFLFQISKTIQDYPRLFQDFPRLSKMSIPFSVVKKASREDRYCFQDTPIDDYLDTQVVRNIYFQLSGQNYKIGQASCKAFPRKADLINECQRLIIVYLSSPKLWETTLATQEKKNIAREKREAKKAVSAATREASIETRVRELSALTNNEFEILQAAMSRVIRISHSDTDSADPK